MKNKLKPLSVYIHIPFCVRKCLYCDFLSGPAGTEEQEAYVKALQKEIMTQSANYVNHNVETVFFGGGTPSVLPAESIACILRTLRQFYSVSENCEITIEVNPGTVSGEKLAVYHDCGINRLSIGLQSAMENELRALGRIHSYEDFLHTYRDAVKSGFNNINIDLMSAIPEQTVESYGKTLQLITSLHPMPVHISAYSLIIEEGTSFYAQTPALPDEDCERQLYKITNDFLSELGYSRYEISNYAQAGYACRHNQVYWHRGDYVGFGIGAASLINNVRFNNTRDIKSYVNENAKPENRQVLSKQEQMEEFMFLGLRMMKGVSTAEFFSLFGETMDSVYPGIIEHFCAQGLLKRQKEPQGNDERIALTEWGIDVSNQVMAEFLLT